MSKYDVQIVGEILLASFILSDSGIIATYTTHDYQGHISTLSIVSFIERKREEIVSTSLIFG